MNGSGPMTSRERFLAAARGEPTDCVAVAPYMGNYGAALAGVPIGRYNHDPVAMADAQTRAWELVGQDVVVAQSDNYYIAEGFGCVVEQPPDSTPHLVRPAVESLWEIDRLRVPDPSTGGRMPVYLEAVRRLRERFGNEVAVRGPGTGPFSLASYLMGGTAAFLTEIGQAEADGDVDSQALLTELMVIATDALIAFLRALLDAGSDVAQAGDSLASLSMISPAVYEKYVLPSEKRVFQTITPLAHEHGAVTVLHICGDTRKILPLMATTGADVLEIDSAVDLTEARALTGGRVSLMGNLDPTRVLLEGGPEDVIRASRAAIAAAGLPAAGGSEAGAPVEAGAQPAPCGCFAGGRGGFILGSGCEVPPRSPLANLRAMVDSARSLPVRRRA